MSKQLAEQALAVLKDLHSILLQFTAYQAGPYCAAARSAIVALELALKENQS